MSFSEERYNLTSVHGYLLSQQNEKTIGSLRTRLVTEAAVYLYKNRRTDGLFLSIGRIWGPEYPAVSDFMESVFLQNEIPRDSILSFPVSRTTMQEIHAFTSFTAVQSEVGTQSILSFSAHQPFIRHLLPLFINSHRPPRLVSVERVLGNHPGLSILRQSGAEESYRRYEKLKLLAYRLGLGRYLETFARQTRRQPGLDEAHLLWRVPMDVYSLPTSRQR